MSIQFLKHIILFIKVIKYRYFNIFASFWD